MSVRTRLTEKRRNILDLITRMIQQSGMSPTLAEIADAAGITKATAREYVYRLEASGYLVRLKGKSRSIRVTDKQAA